MFTRSSLSLQNAWTTLLRSNHRRLVPPIFVHVADFDPCCLPKGEIQSPSTRFTPSPRRCVTQIAGSKPSPTLAILMTRCCSSPPAVLDSSHATWSKTGPARTVILSSASPTTATAGFLTHLLCCLSSEGCSLVLLRFTVVGAN